MLSFMANPVPSFDDLVDQPFDLKSPFRSTVPLLAYWADFGARLPDFCQAINFSIPRVPSLTFEFTVAPIGGRGKASHTDIMIHERPAAIATESKYTEPKGTSVSHWLGNPPTANRRRVLEGWLDLINEAAGCALTADRVRSLDYQLIHRTASACHAGAEKRAVVYHYFDPVEPMLKYYREQLSSLAALVAAREHLPFFLYTTILSKSVEYATLQAEWLKQRQDRSDDVRKLLKERKVAAFSEPVIMRF